MYVSSSCTTTVYNYIHSDNEQCPPRLAIAKCNSFVSEHIFITEESFSKTVSLHDKEPFAGERVCTEKLAEESKETGKGED